MAQRTLEYKGYHGSIKVNTKDYSLFGTILFIDEEISYSGQSFAELEENFHQAVDGHRQLCRDKGEEPPFS
ncbi:hypothetical protein [Desulfocastanea catecholica]